MKDSHLCIMAALIVCAYAIYMLTVRGDGVVFASVVGAITLLTGVKIERYRIQQELIKGDK